MSNNNHVGDDREKHFQELQGKLLEQKIELRLKDTLLQVQKSTSDRNWKIFTLFLSLLFFLVGYSAYKSYQTDKEAREIQKEARATLDKVYEQALSTSEKVDNVINEARKQSETILSDAKDKINIATYDIDKIKSIRQEAEVYAERAKTSENEARNLLTASLYFDAARNAFNEKSKSRQRKTLEYTNKVIKLAPSFVHAYNAKVNALMYLGDYEGAVQTADQALDLPNDDKEIIRSIKSNKAYSLLKRAKDGDENSAQEILEDLLNENDHDRLAIYAYAMLGKKEKMLTLLKDLIEAEEIHRYWAQSQIEFEEYWEDEDFKNVVKGKTKF